MRLSISTAISCLTAVAFAIPGATQHGKDAVARIQARDAPIWAANFTTASSSTAAGFGRIQYQNFDEAAPNNYDPGKAPATDPDMSIPVIEHSLLGRALKIHLNTNQIRWEAAPGGPSGFKQGDEYYFRFDFVLDPDFPVAKTGSNVINQIHQGASTGSPPVSFNIRKNRIVVRGSGANSPTYEKDLYPAQVNVMYKVVYRVKFATTAVDSLLQVWINGQQVLEPYQPSVPFLSSATEKSYWKGATAYTASNLGPLTIYQNSHRVGTTYASVN